MHLAAILPLIPTIIDLISRLPGSQQVLETAPPAYPTAPDTTFTPELLSLLSALSRISNPTARPPAPLCPFSAPIPSFCIPCPCLATQSPTQPDLASVLQTAINQQSVPIAPIASQLLPFFSAHPAFQALLSTPLTASPSQAQPAFSEVINPSASFLPPTPVTSTQTSHTNSSGSASGPSYSLPSFAASPTQTQLPTSSSAFSIPSASPFSIPRALHPPITQGLNRPSSQRTQASPPRVNTGSDLILPFSGSAHPSPSRSGYPSFDPISPLTSSYSPSYSPPNRPLSPGIPLTNQQRQEQFINQIRTQRALTSPQSQLRHRRLYLPSQPTQPTPRPQSRRRTQVSAARRQRQRFSNNQKN